MSTRIKIIIYVSQENFIYFIHKFCSLVGSVEDEGKSGWNIPHAQKYAVIILVSTNRLPSLDFIITSTT